MIVLRSVNLCRNQMFFAKQRWRAALKLVTIFVVAAAGSGLTAFTIVHHQYKTVALPKQLMVSSLQVMGGTEPAGRSYTLVEFLDYQCPPCRANRSRIADLMSLYKGKLHLVVRNFPLPFHHNAASSAAAAEAAREQGKFWPMYQALLTGGSLDAPEIVTIAHRIGLNDAKFESSWSGTGKTRVTNDVKFAGTINLTGTPSFFLCTPQGKVWRLSSPEQVNDLIR